MSNSVTRLVFGAVWCHFHKIEHDIGNAVHPIWLLKDKLYNFDIYDYD